MSGFEPTITMALCRKRLLIPVLFLLLILCTCEAGNIEEPSAPAFQNRKRYDYVGWLSKQLVCDSNRNAWYKYEAFFQGPNERTPAYLEPADDETREQINDLLSDLRPWSAEQYQQLAKYLDELAPFLDPYKAGARRECFCPVVDASTEHLVGMKIPYIGNSKVLSKAFVLLAWKRQDGAFDSNLFVRRSETVLRHAKHVIEGGPSLVEKLAASDEKDIVYTSILAAIEGDLLPASASKGLNSILVEHDSSSIKEALRNAICLEQAIAYDLLQDMVVYKGFFRKRPVLEKEKVLHWLRTFARFDNLPPSVSVEDIVTDTDPEAIAQEIDRYYDECRVLIHKDWSLEAGRELRDLSRSSSSSKLYFLLWPLTEFSSAYESVYKRLLRVERKRRLTHLAVCLLDYYHEHGVFPVALERLKENTSPSHLIDPMTGKSFVYEPQADFAVIGFTTVEPFTGLTVKVH